MSAVFKIMLSALLSMLGKLATEEFFTWLFLYIAEILVKRTDTPHDDAFLAKCRLLLEKESKKAENKDAE